MTFFCTVESGKIFDIFYKLQFNSKKILNIQLVKFQLCYLLVKWFPNSTVAVVDRWALWRYPSGKTIVSRLFET